MPSRADPGLAQRDADAGGDVAAAHRRQQALGHRMRALGSGLGEQDGELVAAQAGEHVGLAEPVLQRDADDADQLVARAVARGVVVELEVVEVEDQERDLLAIALAEREHALEVLEEAAPVEQVGDRVVVGEVVELALEAVALGDVADGAGEQHAAVEGLERVDADLGGELAPVDAAALEADAARQTARHEQLDGLAQQVVDRIAEEGARAGVDDGDRPVLVDDDHGVGGSLEQPPEHGFRGVVFVAAGPAHQGHRRPFQGFM
jgi:hypothetical protein